MAAVQVTVEDEYGNVVTSDSSSVTLAIGTNPASGFLGGTLTGPTASGVAAFSGLSISQIGSSGAYSAAGTGYTLQATDGSLSVVSNPFNTTFVVNSVVLTSTGFVATFSQPFNPANINLWGSQSSPEHDLHRRR